MILISEVADAPVIMGISKPAGLKFSCKEVKIANPLFVGIDVSSKNNVAYLMKPDGSLGQFQRKIHVLNPKQVQKFKGAYPDLPKNNWVDAFMIADYLRFGRIAREVYMDDYRYKALRTLTRARFDVIQNLTREKHDLQTTCSSNVSSA